MKSSPASNVAFNLAVWGVTSLAGVLHVKHRVGKRRAASAGKLALALTHLESTAKVDEGNQMSNENCPIPGTHERLREAHYFLHGVLDTYHEPDDMRCNLNAFVQAIRNITFILQAEAGDKPTLKSWYEGRRKQLADDPVLAFFKDARNYVVKQGNLNPASKVRVRARVDSLEISGPEEDYPPNLASAQIMAFARHKAPPELTDIGVQRLWRLAEYPEKELGRLCAGVWENLNALVAEAHCVLGFGLEAEARCASHFAEITTRWESDLTLEGRQWYEKALKELQQAG